MVNKVILLGNLGSDPEVRSTSGGTSVASLSVATSRRVKKGDEWTDETEWHRVTVWGHDADFCGKYGTKGQTVHVEGRLQTRKWQDKDGHDRYSTEVIADQGGVKLIRRGDSGGERSEGRARGAGGGKSGGGYGARNGHPQDQANHDSPYDDDGKPRDTGGGSDDDDGDEIPF